MLPEPTRFALRSGERLVRDEALGMAEGLKGGAVAYVGLFE